MELTNEDNLERDVDDYDEDIFENFVENVDDLEDVEHSFEVIIIYYKISFKWIFCFDYQLTLMIIQTETLHM